MLTKSLLLSLLMMQQSPMMIVGPGTDSCGQWLQARAARGVDDVVYRTWLTGYLTGLNSSGERDILRGRRVDDAVLWMDQHCRANPTSSIFRAATALAAYLIVN